MIESREISSRRVNVIIMNGQITLRDGIRMTEDTKTILSVTGRWPLACGTLSNNGYGAAYG